MITFLPGMLMHDRMTSSIVESKASGAAHPVPDATVDAGEAHEVDADALRAALARRTALWKPLAVFCAIGLGATAVVVAGGVPKHQRSEQLVETAAKLEANRRKVQVGTLRPAPTTRSLSLPASLAPQSDVTLFPQATGYVRERRVDIGDQVRKGDVLAEIDVPLIAEDLAASEASVAAAKAERDRSASQLALAESTLVRATAARDGNALGEQELDERTATVHTLRAGVEVAEATIRLREAETARLRQQLAFATVVAPFDGTITDRSIEVGDYVEPASGSSARALFRIADLASLRVFVDVPQAYAQSIRTGQSATVRLPGRGGAEVKGTVTRTSVALLPSARTLRVEVTVPNMDGLLLGNAYGEATLEVAEPPGTLLVPGGAIIVRSEGTKVAVIDEANRLHYRPVTLGRDLGAEVEVIDGLRGDERIATNLADEFPEGTEVDPVVPAPPPSAKPATAPAASK